MPLTDTAIRKVKPTDKAQRLFDGGGLYLEVSPAGGKWWRLKYRHGGKEKRLSLGTYPDTGLAEARAKRDQARKLLAAGADPGEHRKAEKAAGEDRAANSFEVLAREWHAKQAQIWVKDHGDRIMLRLENDIFPWLGKRPIADLTAKELLTTASRIADRGATESAHRTLQKLRADIPLCHRNRPRGTQPGCRPARCPAPSQANAPRSYHRSQQGWRTATRDGCLCGFLRD